MRSARTSATGSGASARNPGFSIVVVLTLALGIGLSTVAYSVINAVLFRPLSYPDADRVGVADDVRRGRPE